MEYLWEGLAHALSLLVSGHEETWSAVRVTIVVSALSVTASLLLGAPAGFILGYARFPGRKALRMLADTMLSFPTVLIGLLAYGMLSNQGPLGQWGMLFSLPGIALAQTFLGLPVVIALSANAVENMDRRLRFTLQTLGASSRQILLTTLHEARYHLLLAAVAAYGRIVSEIGISMMVGGNIKWHTRTITTAIALETGKGQFAMGIALGVVLVLIALGVNLSVSSLRRRTQQA